MNLHNSNILYKSNQILDGHTGSLGLDPIKQSIKSCGILFIPHKKSLKVVDKNLNFDK